MKKKKKLTLAKIVFSIIFLLFIFLSIIELLGFFIEDLRFYLGIINYRLGVLLHISNILCITALIVRSEYRNGNFNI